MEKDSDIPNNLKHYTSFENLLVILSKNALHLGDPKNWEDKNDVASILAYARINSVSVGVLCLTYEDETIHHWKTFAKGQTGCRIDFNNSILQKKISNLPGIIYRKVIYLKKPFDLSKYKVEDYPFLKRAVYECEKEYRVFWSGKGKPPPISIDGLIRRITFSPEIKEHALKTIRDLLKNTYGINEVCKSTVLEYPYWIGKFNKTIKE